MLDKILKFRVVLALIWLLLLVLAMLSPGDNFPTTPAFPFKDKIVHFVLFFVLLILWLRVVNTSQKKIIVKIITIYLVFGIFIAILVEYLQQKIPHRSFDYGDIAANILGGAVGIICFYILYKRKSKLV